jgi:maleate isomerase
MYGWRGRLGLVVPSSNTTNEPEFARYLPAGVSLHTARMRLSDTNAAELEAMADDVERCGDLLATADVDAVAYGCTTGSLVKGPGYDEEIESRLRDRVGAPAVATAAAVKRAFDALGVESVAIATPYVSDLNEKEAEFLEAAGYDVTTIRGLGIEPNTGIGAQHPETAYREARKVDTPDADGVFVSCTNYRTFEVISALERDLGKPVVTSNQATLWNALHVMGVDTDDLALDLGQLFTEPLPGSE